MKAQVIKMLIEFRRRLMKTMRTLNNTEKIRKYKREVSELKNIKTELKNTVEGFNSRQDETEERISNLVTGQWNSPKQGNKTLSLL